MLQQKRAQVSCTAPTQIGDFKVEHQLNPEDLNNHKIMAHGFKNIILFLNLINYQSCMYLSIHMNSILNHNIFFLELQLPLSCKQVIHRQRLT